MGPPPATTSGPSKKVSFREELLGARRNRHLAYHHQKVTPAKLTLPKPDTPTYFPPSAAASDSSRASPAFSYGVARSTDNSPVRVPSGSAAYTEKWLSMKFPDMLSASDRVLHHNLAILAERQDGIQQALIKFAGVRTSGKGIVAVPRATLMSLIQARVRLRIPQSWKPKLTTRRSISSLRMLIGLAYFATQ